MTDDLRTKLLTACAFSREFTQRADDEIKAHAAVNSGVLLDLEFFAANRKTATKQLTAALEALEDAQ